MPKFTIEIDLDPLDELWYQWQLKAGRDDSDDRYHALTRRFEEYLPQHLTAAWKEFREEALEINIEQLKRHFAGGFYHGLLVGLDCVRVGTPKG
ncbi:MAG: hypothetical protein IBX71_09140 [Candidatus Desulforudis sp.]|nr:hypothetical protein [Desulforudis sp.]